MKLRFIKSSFFFLFFCCCIFITSCNRKKDEINLNTSDPLALSPDILWAVVIEPYAAFRKDASWSSSVLDHCRYGDILMIEGSSILDSSIDQNVKEIWYRFEQGWLAESSVNVYQNKFKAEKVAKAMTK